MSKCSKKCNEIKQKIDSISGLDDDFVFEILCLVEKQIDLIDKYVDEDELKGTCFNKKIFVEEDIKSTQKINKLVDILKSDIKLFDELRKKHKEYSPSEERLNTKYHYAQKLLSIIEMEEQH